MAKVIRSVPLKRFTPIQIILETLEEAAVVLAALNLSTTQTRKFIEENIWNGKEVYIQAQKSDAGYELWDALDDEITAQGYGKYGEEA